MTSITITFRAPVAIPITMNKQLNSPRPDNRIVAYQNEFKVLKLVRDFGHLRRIEVARGVWARSSLSVAETMAQRTITRLTKSGELFETSNALGGMSLVLGRRGATRLRTRDIEADAGYDLSSVKSGHFKHRSYGTRYLIERIAQGHRAFSEYALSKGWSPITRDQLAARFHKVPDGLVLVPGPERGTTTRSRPWTGSNSRTRQSPAQSLHARLVLYRGYGL